MKAGLITVWLLILAGLFSGCGQKGPLYIEAPSQADGTEQDGMAAPEANEKPDEARISPGTDLQST